MKPLVSTLISSMQRGEVDWRHFAMCGYADVGAQENYRAG